MKTYTLRILRNITSTIIVVLTMLTAMFCITGIVFNIVYVQAKVSHYSMWPTLNKDTPNKYAVGDYAYMNKFDDFGRNNIVIADVDWNKEAVIKRLIAMPGDTVEIKDTGEHFELYVNEILIYTRDYIMNVHGSTLSTIDYYNSYLDTLRLLPETNIGTTKDGNKCIKLNENEYYLMGDNWAESTDHTQKAISYGFAKKSEILGKVDFVIYENENKFFAMIKQMFKTIFLSETREI